MTLRALLLPALAALGACAAPVAPDVPSDRRAGDPARLPAMRGFAEHHVTAPARANADIAQDFLDLTFTLESGRTLPRFTRFEGPVSLRVAGPVPESLEQDLADLLARLRGEAQIDIARVPADRAANVTVEMVPRSELQRAVPAAACFVVPRVASWDDFLASRRSERLDWATLDTRREVAIFIPGDVPPQEVRDCLHEELAQSLAPLNDLYRLPDSVFNDDNFHTVLTGFDMLILRAAYSPELRSGMSREAVARALPPLLRRLNPGGERVPSDPASPTPRDWIDAIETALGPNTSPARRRAAARRAVEIARDEGWQDTRLGFSLFALARLSLGADPDTALAAFLQAAAIYGRNPATSIHTAHIAMQLAAFALSSGEPEAALAIAEANEVTVRDAENAALLSTFLFVEAEALDLEGRRGEAGRIRAEAYGWARYGYGSDREVMARAAEIAALVPDTPEPAA